MKTCKETLSGMVQTSEIDNGFTVFERPMVVVFLHLCFQCFFLRCVLKEKMKTGMLSLQFAKKWDGGGLFAPRTGYIYIYIYNPASD